MSLTHRSELDFAARMGKEVKITGKKYAFMHDMWPVKEILRSAIDIRNVMDLPDDPDDSPATSNEDEYKDVIANITDCCSSEMFEQIVLTGSSGYLFNQFFAATAVARSDAAFKAIHSYLPSIFPDVAAVFHSARQRQENESIMALRGKSPADKPFLYAETTSPQRRGETFMAKGLIQVCASHSKRVPTVSHFHSSCSCVVFLFLESLLAHRKATAAGLDGSPGGSKRSPLG